MTTPAYRGTIGQPAIPSGSGPQAKALDMSVPSHADIIVLNRRPGSSLVPGDLMPEPRPLRAPGPGEVVVRNVVTSVDPYQLRMLRGSSEVTPSASRSRPTVSATPISSRPYKRRLRGPIRISSSRDCAELLSTPATACFKSAIAMQRGNREAPMGRVHERIPSSNPH